MPLSVLMSVYIKEKPHFLRRALQSIWDDQILKPDEIVIVEDGALTSDLEEVLNEWESRLTNVFKRVKLSNNKGLACALNEGLRFCSYELVARMDTDDIAHPNRFERQYEFMIKSQDIDILGAFATKIDDSGECHGVRIVPTSHKAILAELWTCPLIHPTVVYRRDRIMAIGGYPNGLKRRQDYALWFKCAKHQFQFANLPEHLLYYRETIETYKKNSFPVAWSQAVIGLKGSVRLRLGFKAYMGVFFPLFKSLIPRRFRGSFNKLIDRYDPRTQNDDR